MAHTAYEKTAQIVAAQLREAVIDYEAFETELRPCELDRCRATCCHDGVYLSQEEAEGLPDVEWLIEYVRKQVRSRN